MREPKYNVEGARRKRHNEIARLRAVGPALIDRNGATVRAGDRVRVTVGYRDTAPEWTGVVEKCVPDGFNPAASFINFREDGTQHLRTVHIGWVTFDWSLPELVEVATPKGRAILGGLYRNPFDEEARR